MDLSTTIKGMLSLDYVRAVFRYLVYEDRAVGVVLLCLTIFCFLGWSQFFYGFYLRHRIVETKSWPKAKGVITRSGLSKFNTTDVKPWLASYTPDIQFVFNVDNKKYKSDKITWGGYMASNQKSMLEPFLNKYPLGKEIEVLYNPSKPSDCVVENDPSIFTKMPDIVAIGFTIGAFLFGSMLIFGRVNPDLRTCILWPNFTKEMYIFRTEFLKNDPLIITPNKEAKNCEYNKNDVKYWEWWNENEKGKKSSSRIIFIPFAKQISDIIKQRKDIKWTTKKIKAAAIASKQYLINTYNSKEIQEKMLKDFCNNGPLEKILDEISQNPNK
jgi:hypothetical protein